MKKHTRTIRSKADAKNLIAYIGNYSEFPLTVTIAPGEEKRSDKQNRLQFQWFRDAEMQGDQTASEYRAFCKLRIGCKILYEENETFRDSYNQVLRGLTYEQKLAVMLSPFDLPVTSLMTVKQKSKYLDQVWQHFQGLGFELTDPAMMGIDQYNEWKEVK